MVPDDSLRFADRAEAGLALADQVGLYLREHGITERPLVLGMSPGGVPVAAEVAHALGADLDIIVVATICSPWHPGQGVAAVAENGPLVINHDALTRADLSPHDLAPLLAAQRVEVQRLAHRYRDGREMPTVTDRVVVLVDDGMQTGVRARAALRALHAALPAHLIFATPVCAAESSTSLEIEADGLVHVRCPCCFSATGLWYRDIHDVTDDEVMAVMNDSRHLTAAL
jgi:putative phosphoribosyl transferase